MKETGQIKCEHCGKGIVSLPQALNFYYVPELHQVQYLVPCPNENCSFAVVVGFTPIPEDISLEEWTRDFLEVAKQNMKVTKKFWEGKHK